MLKNDYGFNTLNINARYEINSNSNCRTNLQFKIQYFYKRSENNLTKNNMILFFTADFRNN